MRLPKKWNELDWLIYEQRITLAKTWRDVGRHAGKSHEYCRQRLLQRLSEIPQGDVEAYRNMELERLDTREGRLTKLYASVTLGDPVMRENSTAVSIIKELNNISKIRVQLLGLARPVQVDVSHSVVDTTRSIADVVEAYVAGAASTKTSK